MSNDKNQISNIKCQMSIKLILCRSVPPELLWSFLALTSHTPKIPCIRPAQLAELPRSKFDPELFPHSAYVKIFVTFATKVPYLTFCDKM